MIQNNSKIIGLTGGIASGKSTVSNILKSKGYKIIDADIIAREVVEIGKPAYKEIVEYFGKTILNKDYTIDRKKLGSIVFTDNKLLKKLNNITHPYIFKHIKEYIDENSEENVIFLDIALLFEELDKIKKHNILLDEIWLVYIGKDTQIERLMKRNNYTMKEAKQRIEAQISMEEKYKKADRIIDNRRSILDLENNIEKMLKDLQ